MSNTTLTDGYRWVQSGETVKPGDEYFNNAVGVWESTCASGNRVLFDSIYRRKLQPTTPKPPLGLMPRNIWIENRKTELVDTIRRYLDAGKDVPAAWLEELIDLTNPK